MFHTIIVGHDGTTQSDDALTLAEQLRDPEGGRLILATVVPVADGFLRMAPDPNVQKRCDQARAELRHAAERLAPGTPHQLVARGDTSPARGLDHLADERGADLIVLGSTHRQHASVMTGRTTVQRLLHGAPCAVALATPGRGERFVSPVRVCVAYDGSPESRAALATAYDIAAGTGATVEVCRVTDALVTPYGPVPAMTIPDMLEEDLERAQADAADAVSKAPRGVRAEARVLEGPVAPALLAASAGADLLIAGSRSYGPLHRVLVGSVSIALLTGAEVPVLVVPRLPGGTNTVGAEPTQLEAV